MSEQPQQQTESKVTMNKDGDYNDDKAPTEEEIIAGVGALAAAALTFVTVYRGKNFTAEEVASTLAKMAMDIENWPPYEFPEETVNAANSMIDDFFGPGASKNILH